jgi:succinate dehydrogenase / fumarate reductase cytochrome b subunit
MTDRTYYHLKRLHSLSGVVPIGVFLLEHFYTNSFAVRGPAAYNRVADELASIPYVLVVEVLGIFVPILFHLVLGVMIAAQAKPDLRRFGFAANWQYVLQRASGILLAAFITFHVATTRFSPEVLRGDSDLFGLMVRHLENPAVLAFYVLGVIAASYHFGNGLYGFAIHWGLATGHRAQRMAARLGTAVFLVLALVGLNSLLGFFGRSAKFFERPATHDVQVENR